MPENDRTFEAKITWLLGVIAIIVAGIAGIEARIDARVADEAAKRERSDNKIEKRLDDNMSEIRRELSELNAFLRDQ